MATASTGDEQDRDRKRRELLLALFALLLLDTHHTLTDYADRFLAGTFTVAELHDSMVSALTNAHAHAAYLGRSLAGSRKPFGSADQQFAASVMLGQTLFISRLIADLHDGKYTVDGGGVSDGLSRRLQWYAWRLRGTAEEAWALSLPAGTLVNWITTAEESCPDCQEMQADNPHEADKLDKYPGSGQTICALGCKCFLETTDGQRCFTL